MPYSPSPSPPADAPYHQLQPLPRTLWLPALISAVGTPQARLQDTQRWREALALGELPPADADFGDAQACRALRQVCGELGLSSLCLGAAAMAEQLLRTLLWHLDRLIDLQPQLSREAAIAAAAGIAASVGTRELAPASIAQVVVLLTAAFGGVTMIGLLRVLQARPV